MTFTTIELAPDVPARDRRAARAAAPPASATRKPYLDLLGSAGFADVGRRNVTDEYERVTTQFLEEYRQHHVDLVDVLGAEFVADRMQTWGNALAAIRRGWLQRHLYWGQRPTLAAQRAGAASPDHRRRTSPGKRSKGPA